VPLIETFPQHSPKVWFDENESILTRTCSWWHQIHHDAMTFPKNHLPLQGLRVLDFSRVLAGPWCTMLLADAGASVIKVERPRLGDDTRSWGPPFVGSGSNQRQLSTYFLSVNRGKRSIAVNMKEEAGRDICRTLATEWADVLVENYRRGAMESLDMGYEHLATLNPGLVYCSISGYSPDGPLSQHPGYDVICSGMYGLMSITGEEDHGRPAKVGVASTDVLTGTLAQSGILSALYARQQSGMGQKVDVSLMESQLAGLVNIASSSLNAPPGTPPPKRWGTAHESIVPYQAFACKKQHGETQFIMVGAGNDAQFQKLCDVLKIPAVGQDERYSSNASRVQHRKSLIQSLEDIFKTKARDEWVSLLSGRGFPTGPLRTVPEAFACPQAVSRGMVQEMEHPGIGTTIRLPRTPISFSSRHDDIANGNVDHDNMMEVLPPPMLGEHTAEVLSELLQMGGDSILELEADGVIECWDET
jgi:crotonobetainyl-CoA:carnitine CoA-transferase CaiB-like acyl-CoA transferase